MFPNGAPEARRNAHRAVSAFQVPGQVSLSLLPQGGSILCVLVPLSTSSPRKRHGTPGLVQEVGSAPWPASASLNVRSGEHSIICMRLAEGSSPRLSRRDFGGDGGPPPPPSLVLDWGAGEEKYKPSGFLADPTHAGLNKNSGVGGKAGESTPAPAPTSC